MDPERESTNQEQTNSEIEDWFQSNEAYVALNKFNEAEAEEVRLFIRRLNFVPVNMLEDYEKTVTVLKNKWLIEVLVQNGKINEDMLFHVGKIQHGVELHELHEKNEDHLPCMVDNIKGLRLAEKEQDPRVKTKIRKLNKELAAYGPQFEGRSIAGALWGSFYFGDPSDDPDLDFDFIAADNASIHPKLQRIQEELPNFMGMVIDDKIINLTEVKEKLSKIEQKDYSYLAEDQFYDYDYTVLLTSKIIELPGADSTRINQKLKEIQKKIIQVAEKETLFRFILLDEYVDVLNDRKLKNRKHRIAI